MGFRAAPPPRCRKLPRASKDWQAFVDLKTTIEEFSECCPLLERMASEAVMDRHWARIAALTGRRLDVRSETLTLRNIMEAPLLKYREEIEVRLRAACCGRRWTAVGCG